MAERVGSRMQGKKRIIKIAIITYLVIFAVTLGLTGVIDYGKGVKTVVGGVKFVVKLLKPAEKKPEEDKTAGMAPVTSGEQPSTTAPITLPGATAQTPTEGQEEVQQQKITEENASNMAKVYSNMDSDKAAKIFDQLTDDEIILLVKFMQKPAIADIFSEMDSSRVARITSKIFDETGSDLIDE